jgi:hypothetical protein
MDETVASVSIKYKADILAFRQSLMELQREGDAFRAKMESPLKMRASGVSSPGVSGPNIVDTSNGNVTWRLEEAVARTQSRHDSAYGMAQRMLRGTGSRGNVPSGIDPDMWPEFREMKRESDAIIRERDARLDYRARLMTGSYELQQRQAREEAAKLVDHNGARSLLDTSGRFAGQSGEMPWGAASRINPYTGGRMGDTEEAVKPQEKQPWWKAKLSHVALRSFAAFVVVDAVAAELNNEENYKKAVRLAGYGPEGSLAVGRAQIARTQGMFDAIPMIGGTLRNVTNSMFMGSQTFQWQEAQLDLAEQYGRYTSGMGSALRMGRGMRSAAEGFGMSRTGRAISAAQDAAVGRVIDIDGMREQLLANAGLKKMASDYYDLDPSEQSGASSIPFNLYGRSQDVSNANAARRKYNASRIATVDGTIERLKQDSKNERTAQITEIRNQNQYTIDSQQAQIAAGALAGQYRYTAAGALGVLGGYRASVADYRRRTPNDDDASILYNQGRIAMQGLEQSRRDVMENLRWGSGREYNPMIESPLAYTDRSIESPADQIKDLTAAIAELSTTMKSISGGTH